MQTMYVYVYVCSGFDSAMSSPVIATASVESNAVPVLYGIICYLYWPVCAVCARVLCCRQVVCSAAVRLLLSPPLAAMDLVSACFIKKVICSSTLPDRNQYNTLHFRGTIPIPHRMPISCFISCVPGFKTHTVHHPLVTHRCVHPDIKTRPSCVVVVCTTTIVWYVCRTTTAT